ncbi:DUF3124 domain-containing protein [bacterium]|nr:DUF3124 domain-containing protein [bacterium]
MKKPIKILILLLLFQSCKEKKVEVSSINPVNWEKRTIDFDLDNSMSHGTTYLSVYSQIYSQTEHRTHDLAATVSIRNVNRADTIYINKAEYFNTEGNSIRTYFDKPIFIAPMETVEIIIDERDQEGGTGANFLFEWTIKASSNDPFFEAIMISTSGQQGLSFTTKGQKIH